MCMREKERMCWLRCTDGYSAADAMIDGLCERVTVRRMLSQSRKEGMDGYGDAEGCRKERWTMMLRVRMEQERGSNSG